MGRAASLALVLTALVPAAAAAGPYDKDYAAYARNVLPSGQLGGVPPAPDADRQALMYDGLTPLFDQIGDADLLTYFKNERFGIGSEGPGVAEKVPRKGVKIVRDAFHVPHVRATSFDNGIWAAGWISAEDRGLLLQQSRYNALVAAIDAPGLSALELITDLRTFVPSRRTVDEVAKQTKVLLAAGPKGRKVLHDIDTFIAGMNARLRAEKSAAAPVTRVDVYALEALMSQFVGQGGGDEARRTQFLSSLQNRLGEAAGLSVFNDLRQHDDPEQPASVDGTAPYAAAPATRAGNVIIDAGSYVRTDAVPTAPTREAPYPESQHASNALLVDAKHSATGRPLMVGGPQIGYTYPGLLYEIDMHAPGLVWRGSTAAPLPGYMLIGRGPDFATTLTSAGGDIIDQYAETLCDGSDTKYLFKGTCREMGTFAAGVLKGVGGAPDQPVTFRTTVHGPVTGYATVGGVKVAISSKRSSYGREALGLLLHRDLSTGAVKDVASFFKAAAPVPQTFNSFYIDSRHIAMYTSGRFPLRPADVDNGLLTRGDGTREWQGFLPAKGHPQGTDPADGTIVNWNNNAIKGFAASDSEWMRAGHVGRVDLLNQNMTRLQSGGKWSLASVTAAMNAAATQDLRAIDTVPLLQRLLAGTTAPSARAQQMLDLMVAWANGGAGGSRLDLDLDGKIDDPGAAIIDAAWPKIADAFMAPVLGPDRTELATIVRRYDTVVDQQYDGWHQYFDKDIRSLLGDDVPGAFANRYCGAGVLAGCQAAVWSAIDAAGGELAAAQGSDPAAWRADAVAERRSFVPGLLKTTIRYTNRPTGIQQVISFKGHR